MSLMPDEMSFQKMVGASALRTICASALVEYEPTLVDDIGGDEVDGLIDASLKTGLDLESSKRLQRAIDIVYELRMEVHAKRESLPGITYSKEVDLLAGVELEPTHMQQLIWSSIRAERSAQDEKWGDQSDKGDLMFLGILGEEFGEVCKEVIEGGGRENYMKLEAELVQVAAVAVQWIEIIRTGDVIQRRRLNNEG